MSADILYIVPPTGIYAGIERVVDEVCSELARTYGEEFRVTVLYLGALKNFPEGARPYNLIVANAKGKLAILQTVRKAVSGGKYRLVVVPQVEPTVLYWLSTLGLKQTFVLYLHGNPKIESRYPKARPLFWLMRWIVGARLGAVFGVSPKQLEYFSTTIPRHPAHYWVPNPVRAFDNTRLENDPAVINFINVGRLCEQKGQDLLLRAFAKVVAARPNARLSLVGYGDDENAVRAQITRLGLESVSHIENYPSDPSPALAKADIYVSSSRWEGWSLAICEALRFGLPVISTDCEYGPSDILTDERLGRLVPSDDEHALAQTMISYLDDIAAQRQFADFRKSYINRFDIHAVVHEHANALRSVGASPSLTG